MKVVYPGTFDPITYGHLDIIQRASKLFETVYIVIGYNSSKKTFFSLEEREYMIKKSIEELKLTNCLIHTYNGLLVDFLKQNNIKIIIRGLRAVSDYEYELMLANFNKSLNNSIETLFMPTKVDYSFINSTTIKEIAKLHGDISQFVPPCVIEMFNKKLYDKT